MRAEAPTIAARCVPRSCPSAPGSPPSACTGAGHTPTTVDYDTLRPAQHVTESSLGSGSIPPAVQAGTPPRQPERSLNIQPPPVPVASDGVATNQIPQTGAQQQAVDAGRQASSSGAQQEASQARQIAGKVQPASEALSQIHAGAVGAQQAASGSPAGKPAPGVVSEATVQVVPDSKGQMVKHYYRFSNVQLTRKELRFFYPEGVRPSWYCSHGQDVAPCCNGHDSQPCQSA